MSEETETMDSYILRFEMGLQCQVVHVLLECCGWSLGTHAAPDVIWQSALHWVMAKIV